MLNLILSPIMVLFIGITSAMLGIGRGAFFIPIFILVPAMNLIAAVPMHLSIATSMFIMFFTSISGT